MAARIAKTLERLFPEGTNGAAWTSRDGDKWASPPLWPPDLFGFCAHLISASGSYAMSRFTGGMASCAYSSPYRKAVNDAAAEWQQASSLEQLGATATKWRELLRLRDKPLAEWKPPQWDPVFFLLAVADAASEDIGFFDPSASDRRTTEKGFFSRLVYDEHRSLLLSHRADHLRYLPHSLCLRIPSSEICVQPKSRTVQSGCTLRTLSHHLALLPPVGEVKTFWLSAPGKKVEPHLNLLVVPFPYTVRTSDFSWACTEACGDGSDRANFFSLNQTWLSSSKRFAEDLRRHIHRLIAAAQREVRTVHGVVLPESALNPPLTDYLSSALAREHRLELFITGQQIPRKRARLARNVVSTALYNEEGTEITSWSQAKHHRWRLDGSQIARYHLGASLDPAKGWWEQIDVSGRSCYFYTFRPGATLAVLVCEDLARIDPVQQVLRAVGPNLVIALLFDGPQMASRWPGRYATVLGDDPGSAVLTLTSLGLVRRSNYHSNGANRIALWKDPVGQATEIDLPRGAHAMILTLSVGAETNYTADGRPDNGTTAKLALSGIIPVTDPNPPAWAKW